MKLRIARLGVLLAAVLGLMATMVPSAQANTYKLITFTGEATLSAGLGYPCTAPTGTTDCTTATTTTKPGPKKEEQVLLTPGGNTAGFTFTSTNCVKTSVSSLNKPTPKTAPLELCVLDAAGVVTGYCGLSTGMGVATLTNLGLPPLAPSTKTKLSTSFKFTGVGGVLHVTGGDKDTNIYAEVAAIPIPSVGGPSCTNKTATSFLLAGVAYYKDCTKGTATVNGTLTGVCNP